MQLKKKKNNQTAFLLLEAELAVVILLTIVIFVINSLTHLLRTQQDNKNYLSAILIADETLSKIRAYGLNKTFENISEGAASEIDGFSLGYATRALEDYNVTNVSELELKISWDKKPRSSSFNITTYLLNESE